MVEFRVCFCVSSLLAEITVDIHSHLQFACSGGSCCFCMGCPLQLSVLSKAVTGMTLGSGRQASLLQPHLVRTPPLTLEKREDTELPLWLLVREDSSCMPFTIRLEAARCSKPELWNCWKASAKFVRALAICKGQKCSYRSREEPGTIG